MISGVSIVGKSKESSKVFNQIGIKRKNSPLHAISDPSNAILVTIGDNQIVRDASGNIIGNRPLVGPNAGTITYYPGKGPADLSPTSGASKVKHAGRTKASIVAIKNTIIFDDGIVSRKLKPGSKYWAKGTDNKYYEYTAATGRSGRGVRTGVPTGVVSDTRPEGPVMPQKHIPTPRPTPTPHTPRPTPTPKQHKPKSPRTPNIPRAPRTPKSTPNPKPIPGGPIGGLTREISLAKLPSANNAISTPLMSSKVSSPVANALVGSRSDAVSAIGVKSKAGK